MNTKRICLWSGPRNISTTLLYSFAQRSDTKVYDEPLYGFYLQKTNAKNYHPGSEEILNTLENDSRKIVSMMMGDHQKNIVFFKHMTHHLLDLDRGFMKDCTHIILTRDPVEMLPSFDAVIKSPTLKDVGYEQHTELVSYFEKEGIDYVVLDAKKVLLNPKKVLRQLCERIAISFDEAMLHWRAGSRPEDGIWAKYWYTAIHKSTGYIPYKAKSAPFPNHLKPLLEKCLPHYKKLNAVSLE